ncbi:hypothetical protein TNCV_1819021 [Trichonephila clavipes]|nr:hypothetical protein TNCV_1819021 [Trichonephila clavipes]
METCGYGLCPDLAVTTRYQDPFLGHQVILTVGSLSHTSLNQHTKSFPIFRCSNGLRGVLPFIWRHSPLLGRYPSPLKHFSVQEHDIVRKYQSNDEIHVALLSPTDRKRNTPPQQKCATATTTTWLRLMRVGIQISHSTLFPEPFPFLRTSLQHVQNRKFPRPPVLLLHQLFPLIK